MELFGPPAAGLFLVGLTICVYFVLQAGHVRIPDDPLDIEAELDELQRLFFGETEEEPAGESEPESATDTVELRPVA
ncbi:MAG: hypothetical protein R2761_15845 [Acidimicrobiales bacterium]